MKDEDIDFSDIPPITPEMFKNGIVRRGRKSLAEKEDLPIDRDIIDFVKKQGRGYQDKINQLLRDYIASHPAK